MYKYIRTGPNIVIFVPSNFYSLVHLMMTINIMASAIKIPQILRRPSRPTKQCTFQYLSPIFFPQIVLSRQASGLSLRGKTDNKGKMITPPKKKKKARSTFRQYDLKKMEQFSLCDAMRYTLTLLLSKFYLSNGMRTAI